MIVRIARTVWWDDTTHQVKLSVAVVICLLPTTTTCVTRLGRGVRRPGECRQNRGGKENHGDHGWLGGTAQRC